MDRMLVVAVCLTVAIAIFLCVGYGAYKFQKAFQTRFAAVMDIRAR